MSQGQNIDDLHQIIKGYRNDDGIYISTADIERWSAQFGDDADFIITETTHLFSETYFNKNKITKKIHELFAKIVDELYESDWRRFSSDCVLLNLQEAEKSQKAFVEIGTEIINSRIAPETHSNLSGDKKTFIYLDDITATGGTIISKLLPWIRDNFNELFNEKIKLIVYHTCVLKWELGNCKYRLIKQLGEKYGCDKTESVIKNKIIWKESYKIENITTNNKSILNLVKPDKMYFPEIEEYHNELINTPYGIYDRRFANQALRPPGSPAVEKFYSSPENRNRFEKLILQHSYAIMQDGTDINEKPNRRPLGYTVPSHATLGSGCLFATWRNAPNNMPLAFWLQTANWTPLLQRKHSSHD